MLTECYEICAKMYRLCISLVGFHPMEMENSENLEHDDEKSVNSDDDYSIVRIIDQDEKDE